MDDERLEQVVNAVSDMDQEWWPFLFLRPEPHERMGSLRVACLAALYGLLGGLFANVMLALSGRTPSAFSPLLFPLGATAGFFLIYRFTFAYFWNRRAARLTRRAPRVD